MPTKQTNFRWLDQYGTDYHVWQSKQENSQQIYYRPLGIVEQLFDVDGTCFGGRADITSWLQLELRTSLNRNNFRERIVEAWARLRLHHPMLYASTRDVLHKGKKERCFVVRPLTDFGHAARCARSSIVFVEDYYSPVDPAALYHHLMNVGRVVRAEEGLSRLFILPARPAAEGTMKLDVMLVTAHCMSDGLSVHNWISNFIALLNDFSLSNISSIPNESSRIQQVPIIQPSSLPPAQEDLYASPPGHRHNPPGTKARRRWFWAITLVLRHIRRPAPAAFLNPLRRNTALLSTRPLPKLYDLILDYTTPSLPPLRTFSSRAVLTTRKTARLKHLCRKAGVSIGAGGFALVAISMMIMQERKDPNKTRPLVASFPVNPRPFLRPTTNASTTTSAMQAESLMLAFSDGIFFPFLPSYISFEKRFMFLAKKAHKQLVTYQKNRVTTPDEAKTLGARIPAQLLPQLYLMTRDRVASLRSTPTSRECTDTQDDIPSAYPPRSSTGLATCGVSSMGPRWEWVERGMYDLSVRSKDLRADFRDMISTVRVRDGEFLVGSSSDRETMGFAVSGDGNAMDEGKVREWENVLEGLLEEDGNGDVEGGSSVGETSKL